MSTTPSKTSLAYSLIEKLYRTNRNFCSKDYDFCLMQLQKEIPFKILSYEQGINFWKIPPKWDLKHAKIFHNNQLIYEVDHPLKIIGLSTSFEGEVSLETLKKHLFYDSRYPDAIPYHFRQFYRPWDRDWGFCVTQNVYDSLKPGKYRISIHTSESKGTLKVAEYKIKGQTDKGFVFVAHLDHPGMANDDLAGVAVGVELFKQLSSLKPKLSYSLILVPEIIGSEFFLSQLSQDKKNQYLGGCFLEMLGSKTPLALQSSYLKNSLIEDSLEKELVKSSNPYKKGNYKEIICNDETVWQSHQIPMCSLSRFPYPEYHTSKDNPDIIHMDALEESISILKNTVLSLEKNIWVEKKFIGTPCTSHPDLNVYVDPGQRAFGSHKNEDIQKLRNFMDFFLAEPAFFCLNSLAEKAKLPLTIALNYLKLWEAKKLVQLF